MDDGEFTGAVFLDLQRRRSTQSSIESYCASYAFFVWMTMLLSGLNLFYLVVHRLQFITTLNLTHHLYQQGQHKDLSLVRERHAEHLKDLPSHSHTVLYCSFKCSDVLEQKLNSDLSRVCNWLNPNLCLMRLLRRIKNYLPIHSRLLFSNSYILPIFDYADIIWGIEEIQPLCQIYKYYIIKQHELFQTQIIGHLPLLLQSNYQGKISRIGEVQTVLFLFINVAITT